MNAEHASFWFVAVFPPFIAFFLNLVVRGKEVIKSSGADWLLIIFSFDLVGFLTLGDLKKYVNNEDYQQYLLIFITTSAFVSLALWLVVVLRLEPVLASAAADIREKIVKIISLFIGWFFVVMLSAFHILFFLQEKAG